MILPRAQTACSQTFILPEDSNSRKSGTAPAWTTACVCWDVPEAIFVSAHAASNWRFELEHFMTATQFHTRCAACISPTDDTKWHSSCSKVKQKNVRVNNGTNEKWFCSTTMSRPTCQKDEGIAQELGECRIWLDHLLVDYDPMTTVFVPESYWLCHPFQ